MTRSILAAGTLIVSVLAVPVFAQGKSQSKGNNGNGNGKSSPPSRNVLAAPPVAISTGPSSGATPFAWVDDATVLEPGAGAVGFSIMRFDGAGVSEVDMPIVDGSLGLTSRVQLSVTVPHVIAGADDTAAAGGVGTTFVAAKVAVVNSPKRAFKLAVTPTLEILGAAVAASLNEGESRTQFGLPVSAEIDRGSLRMYGSTGFFTSGVLFAGVGAAMQASPKAVVSVGFSHSWRNDEINAVDGTLLATGAARSELSGGLGYIVTPRIVVYGSVGRTISTLDENGAGTTISGGVSFSFVAPTR